MPFSEIELKKIDNLVGGLCRKHTSALHKNELRIEYGIEGGAVVVFASRPHANESNLWLKIPVAQMRFARETGEWTLFWVGASGNWINDETLHPTQDLLVLVSQVDLDPHHLMFK